VKRAPATRSATRKTIKRKPRFVPRVVFGTICIGVVPAFAVNCGGSSQPGGGHDGGADQLLLGVCNCGFDAYGVFVGFDSGGYPDAEGGADAKPADGGADTATDAKPEAGDGGVD
jgi:hypothetical protein